MIDNGDLEMENQNQFNDTGTNCDLMQEYLNLPPISEDDVKKLKANARIVSDSEENKCSQSELELACDSENTYLNIAIDVVDFSKSQITAGQVYKAKLRKAFFIFFTIALSLEYLVLFALLILHIWFAVRQEIILVYMSAVVVETIGAVAIMIKFAFEMSSEVEMNKTLHKVIENFQKYNHRS